MSTVLTTHSKFSPQFSLSVVRIFAFFNPLKFLHSFDLSFFIIFTLLNNDEFMNKYSRILDLLTGYSKQRIEPVKDIENTKEDYTDIIWLDEMPKEVFAHGHDDADCWIRICKPKELKEPSFKLESAVLELWADKETLKDENRTPKLKQSIFVNGKTLLSTAYPQIEKEFKDYVKDKWLDDLIAYKEQYKSYEKREADFSRLNQAYNDLLNTYNKTEQAGDEFELVAGVGLMCYKLDGKSIQIYRHILTCKAEIDYDPALKEPLIRLLPDVENVIQVETDSLEGCFSEDDIIGAEKAVFGFLKESNFIHNIFDEKIKDALKLFAETIGNGSGYNDDEISIGRTLRINGAGEKPVVYFAPALMLRKINAGGISALCDRIMKTLEEEDVSDKVEEYANRIEEPGVGSMKQEEDTQSLDSYNQETETGKTQQEVKINSRYDLLSLPEFLVFTSMFNVYKVQNKVFSSKLKILEGIEFEPGEKPIYITGTRNYSGHLIVAFENGKIGKITMESYKTEFNRKKLKSAYNNESPLIYIEHIEKDTDFVAISSINKVVLFNTSMINPVGSKTTKGFHVMKSKDGSTMAKIKKPEQVKFHDPNYYRREEGLNVVGFYLKPGDEIQ
jgi:hypothetical protein